MMSFEPRRMDDGLLGGSGFLVGGFFLWEAFFIVGAALAAIML